MLFFDESYEEQWYRRNEVMERVMGKEGEESTPVDCLFVVGTELSTGLASAIVNNYLNKE